MFRSTAESFDKRIATVLCADFVKFSLLMGQDETDTLFALVKYRRLIGGQVENHGGRVVNMPGDSILAELPDPSAAVRCALDIQQDLARENATRPLHRRLELRVGIDVDEVLVADNVIYGNGVNIAARLQSRAHPGGVVISRSVYQKAKERLDVEFVHLGLLQLKNITVPIDAYCLAAGGRGEYRVGDSFEGPASQYRAPSVAILNFRTYGGDSRLQQFSEMLAEDIVLTASAFRELAILSSQSLQRVEDDPGELFRRAKEFGIGYFLTGTVRAYADTIRVVVQLVDANTSRHLWAKHFDRPKSQLNRPHDELAQYIARGVVSEVENIEESAALRNATSMPEAYSLLRKGERMLSQVNRESNQLAVALLTEATRLDPDYAPAHVALSRSYTFDWRYRWSDDFDKSLMTGLHHANLAVSLDDSDARTHSELGFSYLWQKQHQRAIASYERAVALNPYDIEIKVDLADAMSYGGRAKESIELLRDAMDDEANRSDWRLWTMGDSYFVARDYEAVVATVSRMRNPTEGERLLTASFGHMGLIQEAEQHAESVLRSHPNFSVENWVLTQPEVNDEEAEHFAEGLWKGGLR